MREQTTFFEQQIGDTRIVVLKTYDAALAKEAFDQMSKEALATLATSLELETKFDSVEVPFPNDDGFADFLWGAVEDGAREDWNSFSYFVVKEVRASHTVALYVSSDWPSAEAFAKGALAIAA